MTNAFGRMSLALLKNGLRSLRTHFDLWVEAIGSGFMVLLPIILIGAISIVLSVKSDTDFLLDLHVFSIQKSASYLVDSTSGIIGLLSAIVIACVLSGTLPGQKRTSASTVFADASVAAAVFCIVVELHSNSMVSVLGYTSAFKGMVCGIVSAELMCLFRRLVPEKLSLKGFENGIHFGEALDASYAAAATLIAVSMLYYGVLQPLSQGLGQGLIYLATWLHGLNLGTWVLNSLMVIANQLLWLIGVNGGQYFYFHATDWLGLVANKGDLFVPQMATPMFLNAFGHLGGAGSTWGLILYTLMKIKEPSLRRLAWYSVVPAIFNVNEILLFCLPLVFSRTLLAPFILAPLVNVWVALLTVELGWIHFMGSPVAWSEPLFISGYLMTNSWLGSLIQLGLLCLSAAIYAPFLHRKEAQLQRNEKIAFDSALAVLTVTQVEASALRVNRRDTIGQIARWVETELQHDLKTDRIELHYQPQHGHDGRLIAAEALMRWHHHTKGLIPTAAAINVAEESSLIHEIGRWGVNRVCKDIVHLRAQGMPHISISVNISAVNLEDPAFAQFIGDTLAHYGIEPQALCIEITETKAIASSFHVHDNLEQLEKLGVRLGLDDFGVGHTSLLYMQHIKLHELKIDGVLTRAIEKNLPSKDIIRCVANLCHSQGVEVVAEFVETQQQFETLRELGCTQFQGYLFSPALPLDAFINYAKNLNQNLK